MNESQNIFEYEELEADKKQIVFVTQEVSHKEASAETPTKLKFANASEVTYWMFSKESSYFLINFLFNQIPSILFYAFFRMVSQEKMIGIVTFPLLTMSLCSSGIRDFQEAIGIMCGPFISKKDYYNYRVSRNRLIFLNCLLYGIFMLVSLFLAPMYRLMGVEEKLMNDIVTFSLFFIFLYGPLLIAANFLKGEIL